MASSESEPVIDVLERTWASTLEATDGLTEPEWDRPSDLPGWTVKDCLSHVASVEANFLGESPAAVDVAHLPHVQTPFQEAMEIGVEGLRPFPGAEVRSRFADIVTRRVAQLRSMSADEMDAPTWSPIGEVPYRQFMEVRVFDSWMHEQDIRRSLGRPGDLSGPAIVTVLDRFRAVMGFVVGKKAAAPDGTRMVIHTTGPVEVDLAVVVDGRARVVHTAELTESPTAVITLPFEAFIALGGGRWDRARA